MIHISDYLAQYGARAMCFTHILPDGTNINIAVDALRDQLNAMSWPVRPTQVDPSREAVFRSNNTFSQERVDELRKRPNLEPIICGVWGNEFNPDALSGFLIDGTHRYMLAIQLKMASIPTWIVPEALWRPYELSGLPPLSSEALASIPNLKRSY